MKNLMKKTGLFLFIITIAMISTSAVNQIDIFDTSDNNDIHLNADGNSWINSGNVGIGTTSPNGKLDVTGISGTTSIYLNTTSDSYMRMDRPSTNVNQMLTWLDLGADKWYMGQRNTDGVNSFHLYSTEKTGGAGDVITVLNTGNVGIGTTSTTAKLEVAGEIRSTAAGIGSKIDALTVGAYGGALSMSVGANEGYSVTLQAVQENTATSASSFRLSQWNGAATIESMRVLSSGNVGIGTNSPTHKLNVVGDINATGNIYKLGGTAVDYVFEEDYNLMPLNDLREFVKENKHLPNLDSNKYTGGSVEVGVLPDLLLEKVEEQTLYILELEERLDALENRIKILEK